MIAVDQLVCHRKPYVPNNPSMYVLNISFMYVPNITFIVDDLNELLQHICFRCEDQQCTNSLMVSIAESKSLQFSINILDNKPNTIT